MASNIMAQVAGGTKQVVENVQTVRDVAQKMGIESGYTATVNGDTAEMSEELSEGDFVSFAKSVKGGC